MQTDNLKMEEDAFDVYVKVRNNSIREIRGICLASLAGLVASVFIYVDGLSRIEKPEQYIEDSNPVVVRASNEDYFGLITKNRLERIQSEGESRRQIGLFGGLVSLLGEVACVGYDIKKLNRTSRPYWDGY